MTMPSFEQVESSHRKEEPCERGCNWIVKFCHCLNFGYRKYVIIILYSRQNSLSLPFTVVA